MSTQPTSNPVRLTKSEAVFAVSDVRETIAFYHDVLGFESDWVWGDPPVHGAATWGRLQVMFSKRPELAAKIEGHSHYFFVDDVQGLYARHQSAGANIIADIENKPWGVREYTVRDINGYHLSFAGAQTLDRPKTATESLPGHVRLEKRMATLDEYTRLRQSVGWGTEDSWMPQVLERSLFGIVAIDGRDNQAVGMVRVCGDGRYFTIWDVIVATPYQGQKIGSAMMEMAMAELRSIAPKNAFVGLFTPKPAFYERFGFAADSGGMHAML
jgi:uncharacterized glyoxalase superfamily protein PhnB/GNAT superfamily N-acetyltransferase